MSKYQVEFPSLGKIAAFAAAGVTVSLAYSYVRNNPDFLNFLNKSGLSSYEAKISQNLISTEDLKINLTDIIGQQELLKQLEKDVIIPFKFCYLFKKEDIDLPKGILLHGPPGCGKTMLAQAIAKKLGLNFLCLSIDCVQEKWYGDTVKLFKAVFSLAEKLKPCVIFIDEIDSFLSKRSTEDHEATNASKSIFLQYWDGLKTKEEDKILLIGATNRKHIIDEAFLSRFDYEYHIGLPDSFKRQEFLKNKLFNLVDSDFNYNRLTTLTESFSFRDMKNLIKQAKSFRISDKILQRIEDSDADILEKIDLPKIKLNNFEDLLINEKFKRKIYE